MPVSIQVGFSQLVFAPPTSTFPDGIPSRCGRCQDSRYLYGQVRVPYLLLRENTRPFADRQNVTELNPARAIAPLVTPRETF